MDTGANWGYYTLVAAQIVGKHGRVVSLEPHPTLFRLLEKNVSMNRLTNVAPLCVAASDRDGEMNLAGFDESQANTGTSRLTETATSGVTNYQVETRLLEPLLDAQDVDDVDLLKIDIEGGEGLVVPTLREGLARERFKHILLELHPAALTEMKLCAESLIETIMDFGYRAWQIDHSGQVSKRAGYRAPRSPREFLTAIERDTRLDDWPHILFVAPSIVTNYS